jgi:hypothetical protein
MDGVIIQFSTLKAVVMQNALIDLQKKNHKFLMQ